MNDQGDAAASGTGAAPTSYFQPMGDGRFRPTSLTSGAWNSDEQHVAPMFGLLAHIIERDHHARRMDRLGIGRISYDILGVLSLAPFDVELSVKRAGRTIELIEACVIQNGRPAITARAWLSAGYDTQSLAASPLARIAPPDDMDPHDMGEIWGGNCVQSVEVRRQPDGAGRAAWWCRTGYTLLEGEDAGPVPYALGMVDLANGAAPSVSPAEIQFPNLDLTVHLFRTPVGEWLGFDTSFSIGEGGVGLTHSILHDRDGPIGSVAQMLTVRPPG